MRTMGKNKVSLVTTILNEEKTLPEFIDSLLAQTRRPEEVIVVDGGSKDRTFEILKSYADRVGNLTVIQSRGANISRGRNLAIAEATSDLIVVTDVGCQLHPRWLEAISRPLQEGSAQVVAGLSQPDARSFLEKCLAAVNVPLVEEIEEETFMPSSRCIAFRKRVWEEVGGYPEWLDIGEDMNFNFKLKRMGYSIQLVREAVVYWRMRETLREIFRQFFGYARGDAMAGMYPQRHLIRFTTYLGLLVALSLSPRFPYLPLLLSPLALIYLSKPLRRSVRVFQEDRLGMIFSWLAMPFLMLYLDLAKMAGYVNGLLKRPRMRSLKRKMRSKI
ncbi:hypothetical protein HKBW3S44_01023 [Candidatus Hakubella thermalkaliphila]|uniref:Glycosyltransferase 2-like domain-containing protein n=5 Tax=Candidatus Hakubella thermalkaliphila TaxID=2754717 RepID=A0A6V8PF63_9ACTN|nr:hypothetical protein HKBW3S34_01807 [Candidatus Hakubella thermalkaliphila]GFP37343.1 hypothetical protein HKBW3S44_01023 [Candidatus Hakubella thermalkaliphila]